MQKSESIKNLAMALNKAQAEMSGAVKDANNPFFKSKYADLSAVVKAVKEPFANNGLSYTQFPIEDNGRIGVETILMHESGEYLTNQFTVNLSKQDAQGAGSAITYCRRYALQAIAGIPSEDDDGNKASQGNKSNDNEVKNLMRTLKENNWTVPMLLSSFNPPLSNISQIGDVAATIKFVKENPVEVV